MKENRYMKYLVLFVIITILVINAGLTYAAGQSSANYRIDVDVIDGGGGDISSTNYYLLYSIGQSSPIKDLSSSSYYLYAGYLNTLIGRGLLPDDDNDGVANSNDNCPSAANPDQSDVDSDTLGDVCDDCPNDNTDTCDPGGSTGGSVDEGGGTLTTPDESVAMDIPAGALDGDTSISITDTGEAFQLTTNLGNAVAVFGISIQPEGLVFNEPITLVFTWPDEDNDGKVDGTNIKEDNLMVSKDNVAITEKCRIDPGCDTAANTFTFEVVSLSEFVLAFIDDEGPVTADVAADLNPVSINMPIEITATVDDSLTGYSDIGPVEYRIDESDYILMDAQDGVFDSEIEGVTAYVPAFQEAGLYTVCARGWDIYENIAGDEDCILLAVYDPAGGFVTGGGWIYSPPGAYMSDPELEGKATFGFVAKYKKGADTPIGQTEFHFKVAGLNFHSDTYQWLVVAGARAQFKGAGTVNGEDNYGFMLTAIDGALPGGGDVDKFRIKIWDKDNNDLIVYDNQPGLDDTGDPETAVGGGSIIIHKKD